ncbi:MAG TPA: hypothetical protein VL460_03780 [Caulobacteraceae bacterium]|jgi:hypothetical protein|nr:hypothetical protein [Caulobacteraceae bacterium]
MIATILAGLAALQPAPQAGEWLLVTVQRVIAPDQIPGQCFVQARIDQVVQGRAFRSGDPVAITMACRANDLAPGPSQTIAALRAQKRALVRLDAGGRLLGEDYYGLDAGGGAAEGVS